eukprot:1160966-Pelagomonas_calceolata.AAC.3
MFFDWVCGEESYGYQLARPRLNKAHGRGALGYTCPAAMLSCSAVNHLLGMGIQAPSSCMPCHTMKLMEHVTAHAVCHSPCRLMVGCFGCDKSVLKDFSSFDPSLTHSLTHSCHLNLHRRVDPTLAPMVCSPSLEHIVTLGDMPQERKSQAGLNMPLLPQDRRGHAGSVPSRLSVGSAGSSADLIPGMGNVGHTQGLPGNDRPAWAEGMVMGQTQGTGKPPPAQQGGGVVKPVPPRGDASGYARAAWVDAQEELNGGADGSGGVGGGWVAVRGPVGKGGVLL